MNYILAFTITLIIFLCYKLYKTEEYILFLQSEQAEKLAREKLDELLKKVIEKGDNKNDN